MIPERWQQVERIYHSVLECEPDRRAAILAEACVGDEALREEVESLLALEQQAEEFIQTPALGLVAQALAEDQGQEMETGDFPAGHHIGPYQIIEEIGRGGMGSVYRAKRVDDQYQKQVAIKLVKRGIDIHLIADRFRGERQILAGLEHPHIARLLDGGATEDGCPYFVMEYIEGQPLTDHSDNRKLSTVQRLKLFRMICSAVQYAHQRLIVHRDIKPANILVTGEGVPKLVDFGIAKILSATPMETTVTALRLMTPEYASPEQVRGEPVTTASDVYALGVVLYELLTGHRPYLIKTRTLHELALAICETEPDKPSTAVARVEELVKADGSRTTITPESVSATRGVRPEKLRRMLSGDLDNIVLKALEKEPPRRYQSALALADDIERYLGKQPILARPPSALYHIRKLIARHRVVCGFTAVLVLLLIAFAVTMTIQSARITGERDKAIAAEKAATQVSTFLVDLFKISDPTQTRGNSLTAREILDRGAARIRRDLSGQPLMQARLMDTVGRVYDSMGLYDEAVPLVETALAARRKLLGEEHLDVAASLISSGMIHWHRGEFAKARPLNERALAISSKLLGPEHLTVAAALNNLGTLYWSMAEYDQAQRVLERALAIREKSLGPDDSDVATTVNTLGAVALRQGNMLKARQLWQRTLAMRERTQGPEHPLVAQTLNNLAVVSIQTHDPAGARPLLERVVRIQEKVLGPKHTDLAFAISNLGYVLLQSRDYPGARDLFQRAVQIQEAAAPQHPELGRSVAGLAQANLNIGDVATARQLYKRSLAIREKVFGKDHPETAGSLVGLAKCDVKERRYERAETMFKHTLTLCRLPGGKYNVNAADSLEGYAVLLRATRREAQASEMERLARSLRSIR